MSYTNYAYEWALPYDETKPVMVALHGFTGTRQTFRTLAESMPSINWLLIDQMGHGESKFASSTAFSFLQVIEDLAALLESLAITSYGLIGYSMGARVALGWAITYPERVTALILESGSPGLATSNERKERMAKDAQLAIRLETQDLVQFVDFWQNLALFDTQKRLSSVVQAQIRAERLSQQPLGLANSLRGMGTGSQPSYWEALVQLNGPILYIFGELDTKFAEIGRKMQQIQPKITRIEVKEAGHCVHVEQPAKFAAIISNWLKQEGFR